MAFYPDVIPGTAVVPIASLENQVRRNINVMNGFGANIAEKNLLGLSVFKFIITPNSRYRLARRLGSLLIVRCAAMPCQRK